VAERSVVRTRQHCLCLRKGLAGEDACVLQRNWIPLLRHNTAGLYVRVSETKKVELCSTPLQQVLHQLAKVDHAYSDGAGRFRDVIDCRDSSVGIYLQTLKAQQLRRVVAVNRKTCRGNGACAHGTPIK